MKSFKAVLFPPLMILFLLLFLLVLQFFRDPNRKTTLNDMHVIAPADGKVVVIEDVEEKERQVANAEAAPTVKMNDQ